MVGLVAVASVGELLRERAREHPNLPYIWCADDRLTFGETDARSDRIAAGLAEMGVAAGDRVAIVAQNRVEFLELFFASAKLGAVEVPLSVFLKGEFLRYQLDDCQAQTVIADAAGIEAVAQVVDGLPELKRIVALDDTAGPPGVEVVPYPHVRESEAPVPLPDVGRATLHSILYTSGTTGMPKGCMLAHGWYLNNAITASEMMEYKPDDVLFTCLPLFHAWARGLVMGALVHRLLAVVDPLFSVTRLIERAAETGASVFSGVGAMGMAMLGREPSPAEREHRLRAALMIPFTPEQQQAFRERFGAVVAAQLYGQTEIGAITYARLSEDRPLDSIGRAAPYLDVGILDDDDAEVPPGAVGEICVRPHVAHAMYQGYWRKPEATVEAWRNLWHHTGDYGRTDEAGWIYFVDRKKDALRRRGENVSSVELERAITAHPAIAEAAVHAIPSPMTEDDIKACIVLASGASVEPADLFAFFAERLPYFAIPRYVEVVPELPRNATMRVMKHLLRARGITPETWDLEAMGFGMPPDERR